MGLIIKWEKGVYEQRQRLMMMVVMEGKLHRVLIFSG
jgi:hypothetical protein